MKRWLKRSLISIAVLFASLVLIAGGIIAIDQVQRHNDTQTLRTSIADQPQLRSLDPDRFTRMQLVCKPAHARATRCPALIYKISQQQCDRLMTAYKQDKDRCGARLSITFKGRDIVIRLGELYGQPDGYYFAVTMNETNLLSAIW